MEKVLEIRVEITGEQRVRGFAGEAAMVAFAGDADSAAFRGRILAGGIDTQKQLAGRRPLSARYMLEGTDCTGAACRLFVENNAELPAPGGALETHPMILTDSAALKWLETAPLTGRLLPGPKGPLIQIFAERPAQS